jgi:hypothetical protein
MAQRFNPFIVELRRLIVELRGEVELCPDLELVIDLSFLICPSDQ